MLNDSIYYAETVKVGISPSLQKILDDYIKLPLNYTDIETSLSFLSNRIIFYGKNIYGKPKLGENQYGMDKDSISDDIKISHKFVENFAGFKNSCINISKEAADTLYVSMFESLEDFEYVVEKCINNGFFIKDEYMHVYEPNNYKSIFEELEKTINKNKQDVAEYKENKKNTEEECKHKVKSILSAQAISDYEYIIQRKVQYPLNIKDFAYGRSKNKLNLKVVNSFLIDNGIDIDNILRKSQNKAEKFAKTVVANYMQRDEKDIIRLCYLPESTTNHRQIFEEYLDNIHIFYDDEIPYNALLKECLPSYKNYPKKDEDSYDSEYLYRCLIHYVLNKEISKYRYTGWHNAQDEYVFDMYRQCLLRRFIVQLIKFVNEDKIQQMKNNPTKKYFDSDLQQWYGAFSKDNLDRNIIISESMFGSNEYPSGLTFKEVNYPINTYQKFYNLFYFFGKALKTSMHIGVLSPFYKDFDLAKELKYDAEPNMESINFDSLIHSLDVMLDKIKTTV